MPRRKAPEILRVASRRIRSDSCHANELVSRPEAYLNVRRNDEGRGESREARDRWAFFNSLLQYHF